VHPRSRIGASLLLAAAALAGCARQAPPAAAGPAILRLSQRNEPTDLDPALADVPDDYFVIRALSEGLVVPTTTGDGTPVPAAADRWDISPDGLTWTFHLRTDAVWSNGDPVTAADFIASFQRVLTPGTAAPKPNLLYIVKNARAYAVGQLTDFTTVGFLAPDPHLLQVTLERPTPQFLTYAASGPWIPANPGVVARFGRRWTLTENFVGNGPFVLAEWKPGQRIIVRRNPRYHGAAGIRLDEIQFIHFSDTDAEDRGYRDRQIDVTMAVPYTKIDTYLRERPEELHRAPLAETRYLAFNVRRTPLSDPRVRRALSLALDRARLVKDVLRAGQDPAYRLLMPALRPAGDMASELSSNLFSTAAAEAERAATGPASRDEARRLLAAAGFPGGRGFPTLEFSGWGAGARPVMEAVQEMWKQELGLKVTLLVRDLGAHVAALRQGEYDIGYIALIPDIADPLPALQRFTTGAPDNYPHWSDAAYDELVAQAANTSDPAAQAAVLRAAEEELLDQLPLAPLYFNVQTWMMRPEVHGWQQDALWTRNYLGVYLEAPVHD
jgi:oligopeptide transport system substrate-binding protein